LTGRTDRVARRGFEEFDLPLLWIDLKALQNILRGGKVHLGLMIRSPWRDSGMADDEQPSSRRHGTGCCPEYALARKIHWRVQELS